MIFKKNSSLGVWEHKGKFYVPQGTNVKGFSKNGATLYIASYDVTLYEVVRD